MSQVRNAPRFASAKRGLALVCSFTGPTFGKPMALYSPTFGKPMAFVAQHSASRWPFVAQHSASRCWVLGGASAHDTRAFRPVALFTPGPSVAGLIPVRLRWHVSRELVLEWALSIHKTVTLIPLSIG